MSFKYTENILGEDLTFKTIPALFSPNQADSGTLYMLTVAGIESDTTKKVLDLGCGYGLVGIYLAKKLGLQNVFMSDIDKNAVKLASENAILNGVNGVTIIQSDGFKNISESGFDFILSNPPYHADFSVPKHFIEKGFNRLVLGGKFYMVTKRPDWYRNKIKAVFGGVKVTEIDGYYIFTAERRSISYAGKKVKK